MKEGWEVKTWNEVLEIRSGRNQKAVENPNGKYQILGSAGKVMGYADKYICEENTTIIGRKGTINTPLLIKEKFWNVDTAFGLHALERLDKMYLFYFCQNFDFTELDKGSGRPSLVKSDLLKIQIPIPPVHEQTQIVKTLDLVFAKLDRAKANLEQNLHNAQALFDSKLGEVFSQRGEGWVEKRLGEITTKIGSGSTPRGGQASYKESGISLIRSMNVHDDGFRENKLAFIDDEQALKLKNVTLEKEDILLNITGASVARCCIVPNEYLPARVNQHVSIIRLEKNILHPSYLHYCLTAQENKNKLLNIGRQGATREAITKVQIENFIISYPKNMNEQLLVLEELNEIKNKTELLKSHYQQKLNNLEELKKSILEKAFRGELG